METLDLRELEKLNNLHIQINRSLSQGEGGRRSAEKGRSAEFSGYREYIPGDDMRYVDWNAYARFDKLFIKEYMEEREGRVSIFLDTSKSMDFGQKLKSTLMAELCQAIAYIAGTGRDSVYVTDLAEPGATLRVPKGRQGVPVLAGWLKRKPVAGRIDLATSLRYAIKGRGGVAYVISDLMDENFLANQDEIQKLFLYHSMKVTFLHVLSKEELEIDDIGAYQLIDSEDDTKDVRLTLDRRTVGNYQKALEDYKNRIKANAAAAGAAYVLCSTGDPLQKIIFEDMRALFI